MANGSNTKSGRTRSAWAARRLSKPNPDGCSAALEVDDFDAAIAELKAANVKFRIEPFPTPVCHMAMIFDPDGNSLCIHKRKSGAEIVNSDQ